MKLPFLILALPGLLTAQVQGDDNYKTLAFSIGHPVHDSINFGDELDIKKEHLATQFTLEGNIPLTYRMVLVNDTLAHLEKFATKWEYQEDMPYDVGFLEVVNDTLTTSYNIFDFDSDGDEDLVCWLHSNMNGNRWSSIYLNDRQTQKLVQLYDHAGDTYIWDAPEYDPQTGSITCNLSGSAFGSSAESTYQLDGLVATPLKMHRQERGMQTVFDENFTGHNGQWKLVAQSVYVGLSLGELGSPEGEIIAYQLDLTGNDTLRLSRFKDGSESQLTYQASIDIPGWINDTENMYSTPNFQITDFNHDGNEDLIFYVGVNVHGSLDAVLFLSDRKTKKLIKLYNTPEGTDVWDTPEYNPKTGIITCNRMAGNAGLSFISTYKLKGFTAKPLAKEVKDYTNLNGETSKGYSESTYTGKKGKWFLKSTVTDE